MNHVPYVLLLNIMMNSSGTNKQKLKKKDRGDGKVRRRASVVLSAIGLSTRSTELVLRGGVHAAT